VSWRLAGPGASSKRGSQALNPAILERLGDGWLHAGPELWSGVDLSWMRDLAPYDHWDVDYNSAPPSTCFPFDAEPDLRDLFGWAKLRIAKGVHDGAVEPALDEVQELARLCFTTERHENLLFGMGILGLVRRARGDLGLPLPVTGINDEDMTRLLRATWAAVAFAQLHAPASSEDDFARIAVGRRAALDEGLRTALFVRPLLGSAWRAEYAQMVRLLAAAPDCRLAAMRSRWATPDDPQAGRPDGFWGRLLWRLPWTRRHDGEVLVAISEQDWFRRYEAGSAEAMSSSAPGKARTQPTVHP